MQVERAITTNYLLLFLNPVNVFLTLVGVIIARLCYNKYGYGINHIPGPTFATYTNVWRMRDVMKGRAELTNIDLHQKYGKIVRVGPKCVSVSDPAGMKVIYGFNSGFIKRQSDFYTLFRAVARGRVLRSLVNITDESFHAKLRRPVSNAFAMSTLVQFEPLVDSTVEAFLTQLSERYADKEDQSSAGVCDFGTWLQYFAFDVIGELTFSKRLGFIDRGIDVDNIIKNIDKVGKYVAPVGQIPILDKFLLKNPLRLWCSKWGLTSENSPVVNFARARMAEHKLDSTEASKAGAGRTKRDFLSRFREAQLKDPSFMTDEKVLALTVGNVLGGSDTTAITLRSIFYYLLKDPSKLKKLMDELLEPGRFNHAGGVPQWNEVRDLPYLDAVVKEALRIFPATGLALERVVPPRGVTVCGTFLPGGTIVGTNAWSLHRDADTYGSDSSTFRPERWLEASDSKRQEMNSTMFSFGAGPRACLGKNISYLEIYKLVPAVLLKFEIQLADPTQEWTLSNHFLVKQGQFRVVLKSHRLKKS